MHYADFLFSDAWKADGTGSQTGGKICRNRISSADGRSDRAGAVIARDRVSDLSDLHESPHSVPLPEEEGFALSYELS